MTRWIASCSTPAAGSANTSASAIWRCCCGRGIGADSSRGTGRRAQPVHRLRRRPVLRRARVGRSALPGPRLAAYDPTFGVPVVPGGWGSPVAPGSCRKVTRSRLGGPRQGADRRRHRRPPGDRGVRRRTWPASPVRAAVLHGRWVVLWLRRRRSGRSRHPRRCQVRCRVRRAARRVVDRGASSRSRAHTRRGARSGTGRPAVGRRPVRAHRGRGHGGASCAVRAAADRPADADAAQALVSASRVRDLARHL